MTVDKERIVEETYTLVKETIGEAPPNRGHCLYLAGAVVHVAGKHGHRLILQAGTCYWGRVTDDTDDGVEHNRFGYCWESNLIEGLRHAQQLGILPEMHVWAADPQTQEIVDLASGDFPRLCKAMAGLDWKAPPPPRWVWQPFDAFPPLTLYQPNLDATKLAMAVLLSDD